jgi:hypothetical protein
MAPLQALDVALVSKQAGEEDDQRASAVGDQAADVGQRSEGHADDEEPRGDGEAR